MEATILENMDTSEGNPNSVNELTSLEKTQDNDTSCDNKPENSKNTNCDGGDSAISVSDTGDDDTTEDKGNSKDTEMDHDNEDNKVGEDKEIKPEQNEQCIKTVYKKNENEEDENSFEVKMRKARDYSRDKTHHHDNNNHNGHDFDNQTISASANSSSTNTVHSTTTTSTFPMSDDFSVSNKGEDSIRITGYLEKRSKMLGWKKFWFVLDGRLLTYYKSKADYDSLSACCGSINLGIASTVRPIQIRGCKGFPIQIVTRSQVYYLRSLDKKILDHWLIAIQEAASSQPQISYPVWADPGAQFFRYSFAALSQWSLNNSTDDITESLSNLPPNFYLKGGPNRTLNNLHKCHSFASLQTPSLYNNMSSKGPLKNKNPTQLRSKTGDPAEIPRTEKVRHSTSMTMLESSEQAAELKKELTKKLSIGSSGENTVKPSLANPKAKSELPFLKTPKRNEYPEDEVHHYDEIVDFEAIYENYEPSGSESEENTRTRNTSEAQTENDTDIYESMGTILGEDPWEKINSNPGDRNSNPGDKNSKRNSTNRQSMGSNRDSLVKSKEDVRFQTNTKGRHGSMDTIPRNFPALPEPPIPQHQPLQKTSSICSDTSSVNSIGDSLTMQSDKTGKKKKKTIGGFFQKMFHRDKGKKSKGNQPPMVITGPVDLRSLHHDARQSPVNRPTNLPVSSVKPENSSGTIKKPPPFVGSKPSFDNENVMDELKLKVGKMTRVDTLTPPAEEKSPVLASTPAEIKNSESLDIKLTVQSPSIEIFSRSGTASNILISDQLQKPSLQNPTLIKELRQSPSEEEWDKLISDPVIQRRRSSQSEEFQQKLAKFNRLSQRLSSSFVSALNPVPIYPTVGTLGRSHSWKQKGSLGKEDKSPALPPKMKNHPSLKSKPNYYDYPRNNRPVSTRKSDENCPVEFEFKSLKATSGKFPSAPGDSLITTFMRSLNKKNSAPDVIFSSSTSSGDLGTSSKDGDTDNVFEEILRPPPIPPKAKLSPGHSPAPIRALNANADHYKMPPRRESSDYKIDTDEPVPEPLSTELSVEIPEKEINSTTDPITPVIPSPDYGVSLSPTRKSADFDHLEALSDLSDTNDGSITPLASMQSQSEVFQSSNHQSYQSNAQTPQLEEQDSLIVFPQPSESNFARDSLSNTPETRTPSNLNKESSQVNETFGNVSETNTKLDMYLQKHQKNFERMKAQENEDKDSLNFSSIGSEASETGSFYENLRFATVHTIVQEFETVEETEDEISEMYDDFPTEFLTSVNLPSSACFTNQDSGSSPSSSPSNSEPSLTPTVSPSSNRKPYEPISIESVRHSGIDQLQEYLSLESNNTSMSSNDEFRNILGDSSRGNVVVPPPPPSFIKGPLRQGAVSRLGHSSAVDQIQRILKTRNDI